VVALQVLLGQIKTVFLIAVLVVAQVEQVVVLLQVNQLLLQELLIQ
jgi:hypothetical protein